MNGDAVIFDRGYRSYEEVRLGRRGAITAVVREGFRRVLGLRRKARRKVLPWGLIVATLVSASILIVLHWVIGNVPGEPVEIPEHGEYFDLISRITLLFAALAGPQLLVPDRTEGVLSVYLSRPLRMVDYLIAKAGALVALMLAFFLVPQLALHLGLAAVSDEGFLAYLGNHLDVLWKVPAAALVFTAVYAALALALAAVIPRVGIAAGVFLGGMIIFNASARILIDLDGLPGARFAAFLAFEQFPRVVRDWIFDISTVVYIPARAGFEPWASLVAAGVLLLLCSGVMWAQYRRLP